MSITSVTAEYNRLPYPSSHSTPFFLQCSEEGTRREGTRRSMWQTSIPLRNFTGFTVITALFLIGAIILIAQNNTVRGEARRVFLFCCTSLVFIVVTDWLNYTYGSQRPDFRLFQTITTALTFSLAPVLPVAIAHTIYPDRHIRPASIILAVHVVLELVNIFGGFIFWVDVNNVYHRGTLYGIYIATYIVSAVYLSFESIRAGTTYQSANISSIIAILMVLAVGVGIQLFDGSIRTTWPAVAMTVILYFLFYTEMILRTDALTKLLNRHSYDDFLARPPLPCAIVLLDVDSFKSVNDNYGHAFGDECLQTEATLIRRAFGASGLCYRTGGDEFTVVVTKHLNDLDNMILTLDELVEKAREKDPRIATLSVGYARAEEETADIKQVIEAADQTMYRRKRARKASQQANTE